MWKSDENMKKRKKKYEERKNHESTTKLCSIYL